MTPEQLTLFPPTRVTLRNGAVLLLRPFVPEDAEALADLYESVPREDARFYMSPSALTRDYARRTAALADGALLVGLVLVTDDGAIAGYAWYQWEKEDSPTSVFGICIRRGYQEVGAGATMMTHLLSLASHIGPPVMSLTVQLANTRAVKLYTKMGFQVVREQMLAAREKDDFPEEPEYYMEQRVRE